MQQLVEARPAAEAGYAGWSSRLGRLLGLSSALAVLLGLLIVVGVGLGPVSVPPETVAAILWHHATGLGVPDWPQTTETIVLVARLPRVLMAAAAGAILAMAGAAFQAMVRNALADPYVLGVSSGASAGAAVSILVFGGAGGALVLSGSAFAGALLAIVLVLVIAGRAASLSPLRLILAGLAVGYAMSSVMSFLVFASDSPEASRAVMFWLLGSLAGVHWSDVGLVGGAAALLVLAVPFVADRLDALASGDELSLALGIHPGATRLVLMLVFSLAVSATVAHVGAIGFVGLVVPHFARSLVGARHVVLLPAAALLGGSFLILADLGARLLFAPTEMAIGVVTGIVGAPLLLLLLARPEAGEPR